MNKQLKDIGMGVNAVGISVVASLNVIPGTSGCTGFCGACGFTCLVPIAGISSLTLISITRKKFKFKFQKPDLHSSNRSKKKEYTGLQMP